MGIAWQQEAKTDLKQPKAFAMTAHELQLRFYCISKKPT